MMNSMPAELPTQAAPLGQDTEMEDNDADDTLRSYVESVNIAEKLDEDTINKISEQVGEGFDYDLRSRTDWEKNLDDWTKLALQVKEEKTFPWYGASNVKYPLLSTAAMQFNARAYPSLIPATGDVVKCVVIGSDKTGEKLNQAKRVSKFLSYQLLHEMDGWEEEMDKLLIMLPIVGTIFKKTYYNSTTKRNVSELVLPKDLVVNYWAKTLQDAERVSQIIRLTKRQVKERMMAGIYLDVELGDSQIIPPADANAMLVKDASIPYEIIEQHTYYDLDKDGYAEPYVITFERYTRKVLRVAARFDENTIYLDSDGKLQKIDPIHYYTKFSFIPNPNGCFYDIGFGLLLSPLNESVNTLINQLIDGGTLNNLQGGFLGKGLKLKMGESQWKPGEWKTLNTTTDDLRKQIVPLPTKEPSNVLFELMGTLVTSGKELASVAEIFVGKMPGQNTPATTTMATIEQGMKVFTAVYKRIYRSLSSEYKKLFKLNQLYLDPQEYVQVLDDMVGPQDFDDKTYNVCPSADPSTPTQTEKLLKAQGLAELLPLGTLDPLAVTMRILEAQEQPNIEQLFTQQIQQTGQFTPPPDPKMQEMQMKGQLEERKAAMKQEELQFKSELQARDQAFKQMMEAQKQAQDMQIKAMEAKLDAAIGIHKQRIFEAAERAKTAQTMVQKDQQHSQQMRHAEEQNKLVKQQTKTSSSTGSKTK
jgi:chaperonin GroES